MGPVTKQHLPVTIALKRVSTGNDPAAIKCEVLFGGPCFTGNRGALLNVIPGVPLGQRIMNTSLSSDLEKGGSCPGNKSALEEVSTSNDPAAKKCKVLFCRQLFADSREASSDAVPGISPRKRKRKKTTETSPSSDPEKGGSCPDNKKMKSGDNRSLPASLPSKPPRASDITMQDHNQATQTVLDKGGKTELSDAKIDSFISLLKTEGLELNDTNTMKPEILTHILKKLHEYGIKRPDYREASTACEEKEVEEGVDVIKELSYKEMQALSKVYKNFTKEIKCGTNELENKLLKEGPMDLPELISASFEDMVRMEAKATAGKIDLSVKEVDALVKLRSRGNNSICARRMRAGKKVKAILVKASVDRLRQKKQELTQKCEVLDKEVKHVEGVCKRLERNSSGQLPENSPGQPSEQPPENSSEPSPGNVAEQRSEQIAERREKGKLWSIEGIIGGDCSDSNAV